MVGVKNVQQASELVLGQDLISLIKGNGMTVNKFTQLAGPELFTQQEIDDLDYMQDKIDIYKE